MVGFLGVTDYNNEWTRNLYIDDVSVSGGNWACSNCTSSPPPCNNPSGLSNNTAVDLDPCTSGILVSWAKDPSSWGDSGGTRSYDILRDGTPIQIALPYGTTSWTDTTTNPGTTYTYSVRYNNGCGKSSTTSGVSASDTVNAPGQPVITSIVDNNPLIQDGIRVYYNSGQGATSHNLLRDGSTVVNGYSSGSLYNPQDTLEHIYKVRAIKDSCYKDSLPQNFTDEANQCDKPSAPVIQSILDSSGPCNYGVSISFTPGSPSTRHDLYVDSTLKLINVSSPVSYNPNDSNIHSYVIRAINGSSSCYTDSNPSNFSDTNNTTIPTIQGPSSNTCPSTGVLLSTETGMSNYQWYIGSNPINGANSYQYYAENSGSYKVSYTNQYGCTGTSLEKNVEIIPCTPNIIYHSRGNFIEITGDGDSNFEKGEKWSVQVNLTNNGNLNATIVIATLEGNGITICTPTKSFGNIPINGIGSASFEFVISTDFSPCGGNVVFNIKNKKCDQKIPAGPDEYNLFSITVGQQVPETVTLFGPDDLPNLNNWVSTNYQTATSNTCSGHTANDAQSNANGATLRILNPVSTIGYTNIALQYDWRVTNSSATEYLDWSTDNSNWNQVASTNNTSWQCNQTTLLPSGAENKSTLYIRFRTSTNQNNRRGEVDYIKITGNTLVWDCSYIGNGSCPQCVAPTQNVLIFPNNGIFSWNETDAQNYRVLRGIQSDLPNLLNNSPDFDCYSFGPSRNVDISSDDPSGVPGKCFYYLVQGYNCGDPDLYLGPPGNSSSGPRQVETKQPCD